MRIHNRSRVLLLILVMSSVAIMVLGVTVFVLFMSVSEQNKRIMMSYAEHQASMLQSVMELVLNRHMQMLSRQPWCWIIFAKPWRAIPLLQTAVK